MPASIETLSLRAENDALCALVDRHPIVCFDVFGILVARGLAPAALHAWLEAKLFREDGRYTQLRWLRPRAEHAARERAWVSGFEDVTIAEIYRELGELFRDEGLPPLDRARDLEVEAEIAFSSPNAAGKRLFDHARARGKKIVLAADTYLPRHAVDAMLRRAGYGDALDAGAQLFLSSSEDRLALHTGSLIRWMPRKLGCDPGELLHVGRALEKYEKKARESGVALASTREDEARARLGFEGSRLYETEYTFQSASLDLLEQNVLEGAIDELPEDQKYWFLLGHDLVAPLMIALAFWVRENAVESGIEKVFFLSRDGAIVKKAYDILFAGDPKAPPSSYMYASRRMLSVPFRSVTNHSLYLYYCDFIESSADVGALFDRLPGTARWKEVAEAHRIDLALPLAGDKGNQKRLAELVIQNADVIFDALAPERDLVRDYLRSMIEGRRRIAVFDIGWWGSLQRAIELALEGDGVHVSGLYFGLLNGAKFTGDVSRTRGFLSEFGRPIAHEAVLDRGLSFFEVLFYGDHAGVQTVRKTDGGFEPVLLEGPRERIRTARARTIHRAVELHVRRALERFGRSELESIYDREEVIHVALRHADDPLRVDAANFLGMNFDASLGDDEGSPIVDGRVRSPQTFFEGMRRSHWKQGALAFHPGRVALRDAKDMYARAKTSLGKIARKVRAAGRRL